uniref:hypothetical protein n=1 Tax=Oceanithermus sp. TaxID=2268145 RepID=UPI0025FF7BA4
VEEMPVNNDASRNQFTLWRVDVDGNVLGPVVFPDPALAVQLPGMGESCGAPRGPDIGVSPDGEVHISSIFRNTASQDAGCDTYGLWPGWAAFARYDKDLNRVAFALLKNFDSDDPRYAMSDLRSEHGSSERYFGIYMADYRVDDVSSVQSAKASLSANGVLNASAAAPPAPYYVEEMTTAAPDGGTYQIESALADDAAHPSERLVRYDAAGNEMWSAGTVQEIFPPTRYLAVAGDHTVFLSGDFHGADDSFMGRRVPDPEHGQFVARVDDGELTWIRWIGHEEPLVNSLAPAGSYASVPIAYDAAHDELFAGANDVLLNLDAESGETKWVMTYNKIVNGGDFKFSDWNTTYNPQLFKQLFVIHGKLIAVLTSVQGRSPDGTSTPMARYRPLVLRFDRREGH